MRARMRFARLHEKVENRRSDFLHKASRAVANSYGTVCARKPVESMASVRPSGAGQVGSVNQEASLLGGR